MNQSISYPLWERVAIFVFGLVFLSVLILIALGIPNPTAFQLLVFRIVLALSAGGIGALIPGFLMIQYRTVLRAGGALAVFVLVYFVNPATLVSSAALPAALPTDPFRITIVDETQDGLIANHYTFPFADIERNSSGANFFALVEKLPKVSQDEIESSTIFRVSDEKVITKQRGDATSGRNMGVLVVPRSVIDDFEDPHIAFTYIYSQVKDQS